MVETLNWLLEESNPSVRYWALQGLLNKPRNDPDVLLAQKDLMSSEPINTILKAQQIDGHWEDPKNMYLPKYTATTHSLLILAELGASRIPAIERGIEHLFLYQRDSGHFFLDMPRTVKGKASTVKDACCLDGNVLYYLNHFGYLDDPRTKKLLKFIVDYHSPESGWKCRSYPINTEGVFPKNCYMGAVKVLRALSMIPPEKQTSETHRIVEIEVEKVLQNYIYRYLRNIDGSRKDKAGWKKFGFPLFYQSDALEVLDIITKLGVHDNRMQSAIDLVIKARQPSGMWLLENTFNGKMWVDLEEKGKPSKWITLRAMRTLQRFNKN